MVASHKPPVPIGKAVRYEVLRTVVVGMRGGRRVTVTADCHASGQAGWGIGPDIDTGAPPSIAAQLMLSGEIELRPGVWAPEQVVPVEPFVRELGRRGMRVTSRTQKKNQAESRAPRPEKKGRPWRGRPQGRERAGDER
jgi:saccharopine dehydrogenase-like NADP-dependent oxidoreductase